MKKTIEQFNRERTQEYMNRLDAIPLTSKAAKTRQALGYKYLANVKDTGRFGRVEELLSATTHSSKSRVGLQGKADTYIKWKNEKG